MLAYLCHEHEHVEQDAVFVIAAVCSECVFIGGED